MVNRNEYNAIMQRFTFLNRVKVCFRLFIECAISSWQVSEETIQENHLWKKMTIIWTQAVLKGCSENSKEKPSWILHSRNQTPDRWNELLSSPGCIWNPFICGFQCTVTQDHTAGHLLTVFICPKHKLVPEIFARLLTDHYRKTYTVTHPAITPACKKTTTAARTPTYTINR